MALADLTKEAVEAALNEFDALGRDAFLAKYGFSDAKRYWLIRNGKKYPSKAIAGVAHKYVDGQQLMASPTFTGGEGTVVRKLKQLGFDVRSIRRNPHWNRDELVLALDLYLTKPLSPPRQDSPEVAALSELLKTLHRLNGTVGVAEDLRNPNGVYLKMMNFRALDPAFTAQGKVGMQSGGKLEKDVWAEFQGRRGELAKEATAIRQALLSADEDEYAELPDAPPYEGEEGGVRMRMHKRYERDPRLVAEKKKVAKAAGALKCEVCKFDFGTAYGALGADFIEVHHTKPVHLMKQKSKTKLSELALLCSNCHRMAHRRRVPLSLDEISAAMAR